MKKIVKCNNCNGRGFVKIENITRTGYIVSYTKYEPDEKIEYKSVFVYWKTGNIKIEDTTPEIAGNRCPKCHGDGTILTDWIDELFS